MPITFVGQGLNPTKDTIGNILLQSFSNTDFTGFTCYVAFVSSTAVLGLREAILNSKSHINEFNVFVGVDLHGTSIEALKALLDLDINTKIFYTSSPIIFHPKIYIFESERLCRIIVGSSNLTQPGLFRHVEGSMQLDCDCIEVHPDCCYTQIKNYFSSFFQTPNMNIHSLTDDLIQFLTEQKIISSETQREATDEKKEPEHDDEATRIRERFPPIPMTSIPEVFRRPRSPPVQQPIQPPIPPPVQPVPTPPIPIPPGTPIVRTLVWQKNNLPTSDVLISLRVGTNVTGCLRLTSAGFRIGGRLITRETYFRHDLFGGFPWSQIKAVPFEEATNILFDITLRGRNIGQHRLTIRHKPSGEASQHNYTTSLHWGDISDTIRRENLVGLTFNLYAPTPGQTEPFYIEIL
jgi:HKD family nuclease